MLGRARQLAIECGGAIALVAGDERTTQMLAVTGLDAVLNAVSDRAAALAAVEAVTGDLAR